MFVKISKSILFVTGLLVTTKPTHENFKRHNDHFGKMINEKVKTLIDRKGEDDVLVKLFGNIIKNQALKEFQISYNTYDYCICKIGLQRLTVNSKIYESYYLGIFNKWIIYENHQHIFKNIIDFNDNLFKNTFENTSRKLLEEIK